MNKLELSYLAPYLPYGLSCHLMGEVKKETEFDDNPKAKVFTIEGANSERVEVFSLKTTTEEWIYEEVFPILRPLSDLPDSIIKEFNFIKRPKAGDDLYDCSYGFVKYLLENHFDINDLIGQGLAIDIKTLKDE